MSRGANSSVGSERRRHCDSVLWCAVLLLLGGCGAQGYVSVLTAVAGIGQSTCPSTPAPVIAKAYSEKPTGKTKEVLKFFVDASDGASLPLTYSWSFGDGDSSVVVGPTKSYKKPGRYLVTVTVSNRCKSSEFKFEQEIIWADIEVAWIQRLGLAQARQAGGLATEPGLEHVSADSLQLISGAKLEVVGQVTCGGCHTIKKTLQSTDQSYTSHPEILGNNAFSAEFNTSGSQLRLRRLGDNAAELQFHHSHCAFSNAVSQVDGSYFSGGAIGTICRSSTSNLGKSFDAFKSSNGAFVRREDSSGTLIWSKGVCKDPTSTVCSNTRVIGVHPTEDIGVIAVVSGPQSFVRRFKFDGAVSWTTEIVDGGPIIHDAVFGKSNSYVVLVTTQKGSAGVFAGVALIKMGLDGKVLWKKEIEDTATEEPKAIFINGQEDIYISGKRNTSPFVMKLDKDGKILWKNSSAASFGGVANVVLELDDVLYIAGEDSTSKDGFLSRLSTAGGVVSQERKFSGAGSDAVVRGVAGTDGSLYLIGNTNSAMFLGKSNIGQDYPGNPYQDGFVMKVLL
ncbi:MAG: PKD domain-containing protein [Gammaproteobacteria bacterium]|nr:PKD domain-containing protein [Gammaproteobacteria bacterium]